MHNIKLHKDILLRYISLVVMTLRNVLFVSRHRDADKPKVAKNEGCKRSVGVRIRSMRAIGKRNFRAHTGKTFSATRARRSFCTTLI